MIDRIIIKQEIPGKAAVCTFCPYRNHYREGDRPLSSCLLEAWDEVNGKGGRDVPVVFKGVRVPEACIYLRNE